MDDIHSESSVVGSSSRREWLVVVVVEIGGGCCCCCWSAVMSVGDSDVRLSLDAECRGDDSPLLRVAVTSVRVSQDAIGASFGFGRLSKPVESLGAAGLDSNLSSTSTQQTSHQSHRCHDTSAVYGVTQVEWFTSGRQHRRAASRHSFPATAG